MAVNTIQPRATKPSERVKQIFGEMVRTQHPEITDGEIMELLLSTDNNVLQGVLASLLRYLDEEKSGLKGLTL